ncbi:hypothetical protein LIER_32801 [Lithospermum erythrorhizon]|uniref:Uncharacterized protein n=1 Tax=Lithospermum erythrorhizon TaxID=34254 RepID=A0AAV3RWM5_LITER
MDTLFIQAQEFTYSVRFTMLFSPIVICKNAMEVERFDASSDGIVVTCPTGNKQDNASSLSILTTVVSFEHSNSVGDAAVLCSRQQLLLYQP